MRPHTLVTCMYCDDDAEVYLRKEVQLDSGEVPNYLEWPETKLVLFTGPSAKRYDKNGESMAYLQVIVLNSSWDYSSEDALLKSAEESDGWEEDPDQLEDVGRKHERAAKGALSFRGFQPYGMPHLLSQLNSGGIMPVGAYPHSVPGNYMGTDHGEEPDELVPSRSREKGVMVPKSSILDQARTNAKKARAKKPKAKKAKKSKKK